MKLAWITDTHWGVRNDNAIFLDYFDKFYTEIFWPEIEKRNIKTIFHGGDLVDRRKYISYATLRAMKDLFIDECVNRDIDLHVIVGNHDVTYKNTNDVNSVNELFDRTNIHYYVEPTEVKFDNLNVLVMPWINNENYARSIEAMDKTKAQVVFGHFEIAGCLMDRGNMNEHGLSISQFKKFDQVFSGHFHHKSLTNNIQYMGTPYELTWTDYQDPKGFHIYDTETRELEFISNPYKLFNKIFYTDVDKTLEDILDFPFEEYAGTFVKIVKQNDDNPYWFDKFMDELKNVDPANIQIIDNNMIADVKDDIDIVDEAEDTLTILSNYIENMGDKVPKKRLDNLMRSLYNEALTLDVEGS